MRGRRKRRRRRLKTGKQLKSMRTEGSVSEERERTKGESTKA